MPILALTKTGCLPEGVQHSPSDLRALFQCVRVDELQAKRMSSGVRKGILRVNR